MSHQDDCDKLQQLGCTDIKGGVCGRASLASGWHNPSKCRLLILRFGDQVKQLQLPAAQNFVKHTALRGAANAMMAGYLQPDYMEAQREMDMVLAG